MICNMNNKGTIEIVKLGAVVGKKTRSLLRHRVEQYGISINEYEALIYLSVAEDDTARDFAIHSSYSKSFVSKTVENLIKNGYISSCQDSGDRRLFHLKLEKKAELLLKNMEAVRKEIYKEIAQGIKDSEISNAIEVFMKMRSNLDVQILKAEENK